MKQLFLTLMMTMMMFGLFGQNKTDKAFEKMALTIFPVIKVQTDEEVPATAMELPEENQPVFKQIAGDLLCFYGIDKGTHFELLVKKDLPKSVTMDNLDSISQGNLLREIQNNLSIHSTGFGGYGFTCGGEHEAALSMLPGVWDLITEKLGDTIVFVVPSKDLIMYVKYDNKEGIEELKKINNKIHDNGEGLLSKKLYTYRNGRIELFE